MVKKVSIIIPIYRPEKKILEKIRKKLKEQTIHNEIIEVWNLPEAKSMNTGIKKAKTKIVVTLDQDCVPENEFWLERLIKPLENPKIVVSVSDLYLPKWYWKKYPFYTKIMALKDRVIRRPGMDARGCAYRKEDIISAGLFNEDPKIVAIESRLHTNFKKMGKIVHVGCKIGHLHPLNNVKKIKLDYNYSFSNGQIIRKKGFKDHLFFRRFFRGVPFLGLIPIWIIFPFKKYPLYFPAYFFLSFFQHIVCIYGFWKGFFKN